MQEASPIKISDAARRELATKPLFPVQPAQRNYDSGGFITLHLDTEQSDFATLHHKFFLQRVDQDSISLLVDGKPTSLYINDSLALAPEGCVLHLLGVGHDLTDEERQYAYRKEDKGKSSEQLSITDLLTKEGRKLKLNNAFTAYVCP